MDVGWHIPLSALAVSYGSQRRGDRVQTFAGFAAIKRAIRKAGRGIQTAFRTGHREKARTSISQAPRGLLRESGCDKTPARTAAAPTKDCLAGAVNRSCQ